MSNFDEGRLRFDFSSKWEAERYDADDQGQGSHSYYRNQVARLPSTKAVDFVGMFEDEDCYLIEVKDFREYRIENKQRLKCGELAIEVAEKVRDTVAGLVGAWRNESNKTVVSQIGANLLHKSKPIRIVLWLEDDTAADVRQWRQQLDTITTQIQSRLKWLTTRVLVTSCSAYSDKPPELRVRTIARPNAAP